MGNKIQSNPIINTDTKRATGSVCIKVGFDLASHAGVYSYSEFKSQKKIVCNNYCHLKNR